MCCFENRRLLMYIVIQRSFEICCLHVNYGIFHAVSQGHFAYSNSVCFCWIGIILRTSIAKLLLFLRKSPQPNAHSNI